MNIQVTINVTPSGISVKGPYSTENNDDWRKVGGKFNFNSSEWVLPDNNTVRTLLAEKFGSKSEEIEVLVPISRSDVYPYGSILQIGGYVLASRRGRDYSVQMPEGVSLESGGFPKSGGSVKNPRVSPDSDTVFRLVCRRSFAEARGLEEVVKNEQPLIEV